MSTAAPSLRPGQNASPTTVLDLHQLHKSLKDIPLHNQSTSRHEGERGSVSVDDEGISHSWSQSRTKTQTKTKSKSKSNSRSKSHSLGREPAIKVSDQPSDQVQIIKQPIVKQTKPLAPMPQLDATRARDVLAKSKYRRPPRLRTQMDLERDRYPFCLVWAPLPVTSWFMPLVGHTGISNSKGVIYDFSDDFNVSVDNFSFGSPTKYYQFDPAEIPHQDKASVWDSAIAEVSDQYAKMRHSFCFNNCHQHVASVLNKVNYAHAADWSQTDVCSLITFYSSYNGCLGFFRQWWPMLIILLAIIVFASLSFL